MGEITYQRVERVSREDFVDLLKRSTLSERRPVDDAQCIEGMLREADLCIVAYDGETLVGISRSLTDFHYACYLSDLAVDASYQRCGIGRELVAQTKRSVGPRCKVILLSAPDASTYYPKIGFAQHPSAWVL